MADSARSDNPHVQQQLDRFARLSHGRDILGLEPVTRLLDALGNPHRDLPPVFHVAGTNGKGSTCAFLRAAIEASGQTAHVYTSPHLVRFNERIRVAGTMISDEYLAPLLGEVLDAAEARGMIISFFEATTAAAFLAFSRSPADAVILEVGLGGRLDATNVIESPAVCGIAQLGIDHQGFLGNDAVLIAGEKAGIAKKGVPLVTMAYDKPRADRVGALAAKAGAIWHPKGVGWDAVVYEGNLHYKDADGKLKLPLPTLPGGHQAMNAALAVAMIRHQTKVVIPTTALKAAMGWAHWPARLQRLTQGPLAGLREVWLDGGHNEAAGATIAEFFAGRGRPLHLITGILANKDARGLLGHFKGIADRLTSVPVPGHECHAPEALAAIGRELGMESRTAGDIHAALDTSDAPVTLYLVSLYLAGEVLIANDQLPD
jgi:dihydrofolate synthase / folylpolyglutamate synthase